MVNATSNTPNRPNPTRMHPIAYGSRNARMNRSASVGDSGPRSASTASVEAFAAPDDLDSTTIYPRSIGSGLGSMKISDGAMASLPTGPAAHGMTARLVFDFDTRPTPIK